jgi:hypothetical protein
VSVPLPRDDRSQHFWEREQLYKLTTIPREDAVSHLQVGAGAGAGRGWVSPATTAADSPTTAPPLGAAGRCFLSTVGHGLQRLQRWKARSPARARASRRRAPSQAATHRAVPPWRRAAVLERVSARTCLWSVFRSAEQTTCYPNCPAIRNLGRLDFRRVRV